MSNDARKIEKAVWDLSFILFFPIEILAACAVLLTLIGWKALAGVSFYVVLICCIIVLSHQSGKLRLKTQEARDKRLEVMNEVVHNVRAVKIHAWEMKFAEIINQLRR